MSEVNTNSNRSSSLLMPLLICTIVVLANTSQETFEKCMPYGREYFIHHVTTLAVCGALIVFACLCPCLLMSINQESESSANMMVMGITTLALMAVYLWSVIILWKNDPDHTVMFYNGFWTETPTLCDHTHWSYIMSYVIYRIMSVSVMLTLIGLGICTLCIPCMYFMNKQHGNVDTHFVNMNMKASVL
jgi:hypothetical protein